jgi:hypothetical protein
MSLCDKRRIVVDSNKQCFDAGSNQFKNQSKAHRTRGMPGSLNSDCIVAPPPIDVPKGPIAPKFEEAEHKCVGLAAAYRDTAVTLACHFFDAGRVTLSPVGLMASTWMRTGI